MLDVEASDFLTEVTSSLKSLASTWSITRFIAFQKCSCFALTYLQRYSELYFTVSWSVAASAQVTYTISH